MTLSGRRKRPRAQAARQALTMLVVMALMAGAAGCWGARELEERSFVTLMGVDRADDGRLLISVVIAVPRVIGGGGSGGSGSEGASFVMSGVGRNIEDALRSIELQNSRELSTVYLTFVILGRDFAGTDVSPIIDVFSRHLHFKPSTLVAVCREKAFQFLSGIEMQEEVEPSQALLKLVSTGSDSLAACPIVTMHEFMVAFNTRSSDPWAPYVGLASPIAAEQDAGAASDGEQDRSQSRGGESEGNQPSGKVAVVLGSALFTNRGQACLMSGVLDTWESLGTLLLGDEVSSGLVEIAYPGDQAQSSLVIHHSDSGWDLSLDGGAIEVRFHVVLTASVSESAVGGQMPERQQEFRQAVSRTAEQEIRSLLEKTFAKITAANSDVLGLARSAQPRFATHAEWEAFNWQDRFSGIVATFDVKVHLFTMGFTLEKPYPH